MSVFLVKLKNVGEVERVVKVVKEYSLEGNLCFIWCVGDGYLWLFFFVDKNNILMYILELILENGKWICFNEVCVIYYQNLNENCFV